MCCSTCSLHAGKSFVDLNEVVYEPNNEFSLARGYRWVIVAMVTHYTLQFVVVVTNLSLPFIRMYSYTFYCRCQWHLVCIKLYNYVIEVARIPNPNSFSSHFSFQFRINSVMISHFDVCVCGSGVFKNCTGMLKVDFRISTITIPRKVWFCDTSVYQIAAKKHPICS